ncbi:hypothetical protein N9242_03205 [Vicingaceae bacterium]|nr:hypothetical protein [Vicingaceae bacterium]
MTDTKDHIPVAELADQPPGGPGKGCVAGIIIVATLAAAGIFAIVIVAGVSALSRIEKTASTNFDSRRASSSFKPVLVGDESQEIRSSFDDPSSIANAIDVKEFTEVMDKMQLMFEGSVRQRNRLFDLDRTIDRLEEWGMNIPDAMRSEYKTAIERSDPSPHEFDRYRLISAESISQNEAVVSAYVWNDGEAASYRFWFTNRKGGWKFYDWQELAMGYRYSQFLAMANLMPNSSSVFDRVAANIDRIGDGSVANDLINLTSHLETEVSPEFQEPLNVLVAFAWLRLGAYQKCVNVCNSSRNPESFPSLYHAKAIAYFELGEFENAIESCLDFQASIGRSPGTQQLLAESYEALGDEESALREYWIAFELDPNGTNLRSYLSNGKLSSERIRKIFEASDDSDSMLLRLLNIFISEDSLRGLKSLKDAIADQSPDSSTRFVVGGQIALESGDDEEALRLFETALATADESQTEQLQYKIANIKIKKGKAIDWLKTSDDPERAFSIIQWWMYDDTTSIKEKSDVIDAYLEIDPKCVEARLSRADHSLQFGRREEARKIYEEILESAVSEESDNVERISNILVNIAADQNELADMFRSSKHKEVLYSKFASRAFRDADYKTLEQINGAYFPTLLPASKTGNSGKLSLRKSLPARKRAGHTDPLFYELAVEWNKTKSDDVFRELYRLATDRNRENQRLAIISAELLLDDLTTEMENKLASSQMSQEAYIKLLSKLRQENKYEKLQAAFGRFLNSVNRRRKMIYQVAIAHHANHHHKVVKILTEQELIRLQRGSNDLISNVQPFEIEAIGRTAVDSYFKVGKSAQIIQIAEQIHKTNRNPRVLVHALCRDNQVGKLKRLLAAEPTLIDAMSYEEFGDKTPVLLHPEMSDLRERHPPYFSPFRTTETIYLLVKKPNPKNWFRAKLDEVFGDSIRYTEFRPIDPDIAIQTFRVDFKEKDFILSVGNGALLPNGYNVNKEEWLDPKSHWVSIEFERKGSKYNSPILEFVQPLLNIAHGIYCQDLGILVNSNDAMRFLDNVGSDKWRENKHYWLPLTTCTASEGESDALRIEKFRQFKETNAGRPLQIAIEVESDYARELIWFDVQKIEDRGFEQSELRIAPVLDSALMPTIKKGLAFVAYDNQAIDIRVKPQDKSD